MRTIWKSAIIVGAIAGVAILGAMFLAPPAEGQAPGGKNGKGGPPPAPKVLVTAVQTGEVSEQKTFVGTVMPIRRSLVGSAAAGRVEEYLVNESDWVQAGQPIAKLRRGIIQAELDAAKGDLAVRQAELAELEKSLQDEIEQAQAKVDIADANVAFRKAKLDRAKNLGTSISREVLEEESAAAVSAAGALREARAALRLLTEGARDQKTQQAKARVEAALAEVQRLTEQFERHTMFAPFDGFVSAEHTEIGQWVMQGDPVAEIVELRQVDVEIAVVEDYIAHLDSSVVGEVEVPALGQKFPGQVAIVNVQADARARTFPVKVRVENQFDKNQPLVKAGMFARVTLPVGQPIARTLVPKDAVVLGGPSPLVFVAAPGKDGKSMVQPVPVKLGPATGEWMSVEGPLKAGDQVIVEGNERVRPGQEVRTEAKVMKP